MEIIENIHHLHFWQANEHDLHLEFHVNLKEDIKVSQTESIRNKLENILENKFGINHLTVQLEYECCSGVELW